MTPELRRELTQSLSRLGGEIAQDLRAQMLAPGAVQQRARALHADERVGDDFAVWTDLLSRRAAVLWVLKSVYVRVLEDRRLLQPARIADPESQQLFERMAPNLGETAYLRWVYRDLAKPRGGLPELFAPQPAEVAQPADVLSRKLLGFWRTQDVDAGVLRWRFDAETFDGELMGDLYQELDPVVKERYALLQTPAFVRDFLLAETLTPAVAEWGADAVRVLDPSCGSGHFLLESFRRLVAGTAEKHPDWPRVRVVTQALQRVVGIDLNDYACALARARLVMLALELSGERTLAAAGAFHPHVYWADGLEQVERESAAPAAQMGLPGLGGEEAPPADPTRALLTPPETRRALRPVLAEGFHVVVGNPPYITEKDSSRKAYHREKVGRERRYRSAYREYSLASPFTERCFQLARRDGYVGLITSNNFMKREFGRALIEEVLAHQDLLKVVDTSGAFIPGHGTPTVLLFARHRPPKGETVRAVMGKRGEPSSPADPAKGLVWSSIAEGHGQVGFETEYVSVADVPRGTLQKHPWSLGGGGAAELKERLDNAARSALGALSSSIGRVAHTGCDHAYVIGRRALNRLGIKNNRIAVFVEGDQIRDWALFSPGSAVFPYRDDLTLVDEDLGDSSLAFLWLFRAMLWERREPQGTHRELGMTWYQLSRFHPERFRGKCLSFAFFGTHNHFVIDCGNKVFKHSAPIIKLQEQAREEDYLALSGILNSSAACFWMKQVFHCKGAQGVNEGIKAEPWMQFYEFDSTKIRAFPVVAGDEPAAWAHALDELARSRRPTDRALAMEPWSDARTLGTVLAARREADTAALLRMVGLQEELDWLCYRLYGLVPDAEVLTPDMVPPLTPGQRPFEITLAREDVDRRAALARGENPDESPTAWFERHGWTPCTAVPTDLSPGYRALVERRLALTAANRDLALIEQPTYKRRWYRPDYAAEEQAALRTWLADRLEETAAARGAPATARQLAAAVQADPRVNAAAEVLTGRRDFDLEGLFGDLLAADAVPVSRWHRYSAAGQAKRDAWESTWALQRREDAGEAVAIAVPPSYTQADFIRAEHFRLRGKLDVPKERFLAFTEVPVRSGADALYGWAGWTPLQRVRALVALDETLEDEGVPVDDRAGLLDSAWRLLPDVERDDPRAASQLRNEIRAQTTDEGPTAELVARWLARNPPPRGRGGRKAKPVAVRPEPDHEDEA